MPVLLDLTPIQQAVKDHFERGGPVGTVLLVALALVAAVPCVYVLTRLRERLRRPRAVRDPARLYRELLDALPLSAPQKALLLRIGAGAPHPATLLMSPRLFDRAVRRWRRAAPDPDRQADSEAQPLSAILFGP